MKDARRKKIEECYYCMDLGSFCKYHDYSKTIIESEVVRKFILSQDEPYDSDTLEIAVMHGIAHARKSQAAEVAMMRELLERAEVTVRQFSGAIPKQWLSDYEKLKKELR